jgi:hypothetical protein
MARLLTGKLWNRLSDDFFLCDTTLAKGGKNRVYVSGSHYIMILYRATIQLRGEHVLFRFDPG